MSELTADERYMALAVRMAERGLGLVAPNPSVGAVLVYYYPLEAPEILARAWTGQGGRPHAETIALEKAGRRARGATLYVTLEPCAHHGKTPPCTDAIIAAGVREVFVGTGDPDPRVAGKGVAALRKAGIEVVTGVLAEEARWVSLGHIRRVTAGRPFVQLKLAVSADERVARGDGGKPVWVTGPEARAHGHLLRAMADAILIGRGTAMADDPALTCRLPGMEQRSPQPVLLDSGLRLDRNRKLLRHKPIVAAADGLAASAVERFEAETGARVLPVAHGTSGLDLAALLAALADRGITRLLVEAGPTVAASMLVADLVDEVVVYRSPQLLGQSGLPALPAPGGLAALEDPQRWRAHDTRPFGADTMTVYRRIEIG